VLQRFARFLLEQLRAEDVPARYGGEEFVVVMPQTGPEGALTVANRLIDAAARQKLHDLVRIRFSAGLATYPEHGLSVRQILGAADTAMYQAKISGKGTVRQAHADKRSHERYRAELDVLYSFDGTFVNTGVTRDLSLSGVRFETDKRLEVGQPITLTIRSTNDDATYRVRSHVVWLNEVQDKQVYRCGAKYAQPQNDVAESLVEQVASQHP
jgi:Tfp pilus assembly protein PilZ